MAFTSPDNVLAYRFGSDQPARALADVSIVSTVDRGCGLGSTAGRASADPSGCAGRCSASTCPRQGSRCDVLLGAAGGGSREYGLVALGSTPRRLEALVAGECDATMLNAGTSCSRSRPARCLARVADVCAPYVGTVLRVHGDRRLADSRELAAALHVTARDLWERRVDDVAVDEAEQRLGLPRALAERYVDRPRAEDEGLIRSAEPDLAGLATSSACAARTCRSRRGRSTSSPPRWTPSSGLLAPVR